jgi:hydrogenase large subunit
MAVTKVIDPVTRLEGHLKIEVTVDAVDGAQRVVDARATGTLFRGFESILLNRHPWDAQHITQRICGVCPVSHGMAAVSALDRASGVSPPANGRILRNLVLGSNYLQSHVLHFYHLMLQDFVDGPAMAPWQPSWGSDKRIAGESAKPLVDHYVAALEIRRKAHEMGAIFGGRLPHPPAFIPGGMTTTARADRIARFKQLLADVTGFIQDVYCHDALLLEVAYNDYFTVGRGPGNLLAYGVFDDDPEGSTKLLRRGRVQAGSIEATPVDLAGIAEDVSRSWYAGGPALKPAEGATAPLYPKDDAYSWLKAPRYEGEPSEVGPLARMWVNGDYRHGISVMDRVLARAHEALKVARAMASWAESIEPEGPVWTEVAAPAGPAAGVGLTEAPRGALGHWMEVSGGVISRYQVVTPTCWNASPRDGAGKRGPMEEALVGTPVKNVDEPVEVLRVIHSFDPCLSCAVHVARPREGARVQVLGGVGAA